MITEGASTQVVDAPRSFPPCHFGSSLLWDSLCPVLLPLLFFPFDRLSLHLFSAMDPPVAEISAITDLSKLLDWVGVEDATPRLGRTSLLKALGGPKMIRQLVAIPAALYEDTMAKLKIGMTGGAAEDPTPLEVGQLGELRRVARLVLGLAPEAALALRLRCLEREVLAGRRSPSTR